MRKFILILGIIPLFNFCMAQSKMTAPNFTTKNGKISYSKVLIALDSSYTSERLFDIATQFIEKYPSNFKIYANDKYNSKTLGSYYSGQYPVYNINDAMSISGLFEISIKQGIISFTIKNLEYKLHPGYELSKSSNICRHEDKLENLLTCSLKDLYHNVVYKNLWTLDSNIKSLMSEFQFFFMLFEINFEEKADE